MKTPDLTRYFAPVLFAALLFSCAGDNGDSEQALNLPEDGCYYTGLTRQIELGSWRVFFDESSGYWWIRTADNAAVAESPGSCPGLAPGPLARSATETPYFRYLFGAFQIEMDTADNSLDWTAHLSEDLSIETNEEELRLIWNADEDWTALVFSLYQDRDLSLRLEQANSKDSAGEIALSCRPNEAFFGLGTQVAGMDLRGRTYPLWSQEQGNNKNDDPAWPLENYIEAAYAPMGLWHSSAGYAAIIGHDGYHEIDLCHAENSQLRLRSYPDLPEIIFVKGDTPKERMSSLTTYVGRIDTAPDWIFGPWNDAVSGPQRLHQVAEHLREHQIPSSAIWTEDWIGGELTATGFRLSYRWSWDPETYPDLPTDIQTLQSKGFAFLAYFNPFVPTTVPRYDEAAEAGHLILNSEDEVYLFRDPAFRNASLVDLSSPAARDWTLSYMIRAIDELNIDGWMADFAEWLPLNARFYSQESPWRVHNLYPIWWQEVNRQAFEQARQGSDNWTYFARSGWASARGGTPGIAPTLWGGDQNTDWTFTDGLPTIVPIGAHAGLSGVAIYGSDIAGYSSLNNDNTDKELFLRWAAIGTFHPLMRTHHGGDKCNNWFYDSDEETLGAYRRFARIHTLLLPYFRRLRSEAKNFGWPMIRHPYLVEGNEPRLWTGQEYQYFLGDDLMIAPILKQGETTREVELPSGDWWPLLGDAPLPDNTLKLQVHASASEIPAFVRGARLLPLLGFAPDSFYGATDPEVTDLDDVAGFFRVALYPDRAGSVIPSQVGKATISVEGLSPSSDWQNTQLDGASVLPCADEPTPPCATADTLLLSASNAQLQLGDATITIESTDEQTYLFGIGKAGWGELSETPPITDLDPPFESYCDSL